MKSYKVGHGTVSSFHTQNHDFTAFLYEHCIHHFSCAMLPTEEMGLNAGDISGT